MTTLEQPPVERGEERERLEALVERWLGGDESVLVELRQAARKGTHIFDVIEARREGLQSFVLDLGAARGAEEDVEVGEDTEKLRERLDTLETQLGAQ